MKSDNVLGFSHVALLVSDLERSKKWYGDLLGWTEVFAQPMPPVLGDTNGFTGMSGDISMGQIAGVGVEFVQMHTTLRPWQRNDHQGLFLLSVRVADVAAARKRCADLGVEIVREVPIGMSITMIVADPDGQEIAIVGPPP